MLTLTTGHTFIQAHHLANLAQPVAVSYLTFLAIGTSILGAWLNSRHDYILTQLRAQACPDYPDYPQDPSKNHGYGFSIAKPRGFPNFTQFVLKGNGYQIPKE
ncbi:hypothetical protein Fcan01_11347 [Folsomia candida]|uniref:Uncharacterized protein n=1 Tax=Folsomia candida TaxID=158441 RepID=A0A226EBS1_FOLCA|nr:hypothetical protein Fcan01_11347 [Folsomia candida]